ncbi:MAG: hypothetical protein DRG63_12870 [Deltaproteobacteria bacterium]|nr:MAG: hypothetical protein DRG63_12870 [Deltaproteobacteria bacterium]
MSINHPSLQFYSLYTRGLSLVFGNVNRKEDVGNVFLCGWALYPGGPLGPRPLTTREVVRSLKPQRGKWKGQNPSAIRYHTTIGTQVKPNEWTSARTKNLGLGPGQ